MSQIEDRLTEILIKKFQSVGWDRTLDSLTIRDIRELVDSICNDINERTVSRIDDKPKDPDPAYRRGPATKQVDDDEPPF